MLGGRPAPACGFAIGVERVIELLRETRQPDRAHCDVYMLHQGGATTAVALHAAERLRDAGLDVILHGGEASLKSQMKRADASGAAYAVIVGETEAAGGAAAVKALRAVDPSEPFATQRSVPLDGLAAAVAGAVAATLNRQ
jgi:histidyl-tRNA synthetase